MRPAAVGRTLSNDLQAAALSLFPALRKTLNAGQELGALGAIVAGSGPTCVFLAANAQRAVDLAVGAVRGRGVPGGGPGGGPGAGCDHRAPRVVVT